MSERQSGSTSPLLALVRALEDAPAGAAVARRSEYRLLRIVSWRSIARRAGRFAQVLLAAGLESGGRVLLLGPNSPEWVVVFLGTLLAGGVSIPLDASSPSDFIRSVVAKSHPRFAVLPSDIMVSDIPDVFRFEDVLRLASAPVERSFALPEVDIDALAQIVFTSGTTAEPKGVLLTHRNLCAHFDAVEREIGAHGLAASVFGLKRFLGLLPLSHLFGQMLQLFVPAIMRASVFFLDAPSPAAIIDAVRRSRIPILVTVPRILAMLGETIRRRLTEARGAEDFDRRFERVRDLSPARRILAFRDAHRLFDNRLWVFLVGGATLDRDVEEFWRRLGFAVFQGYGLTETAPIISLNNPFSGRVGSIGTPFGEQEVKLAEDGEILVRGPNVSPGYLEETPGVKEDGWFHTGDLARREPDGSLTFLGRKKDIIVSSDGLNVYPSDVEAALRRIPGVRDAAVLGMSKGKGQAVHAVLLLESNAEAPGRIVERANASLAARQRISSFSVYAGDDFPRTPAGKVKKRLLETGRPAQEEARPRTRSRVAQLIERLTGREASDEASLGDDLGLSSLDRVELATLIEEETGRPVADSLLADETTVAQLESQLAPDTPLRAAAGPRRAASLIAFPRWSFMSCARALRLLLRHVLVAPVFRHWTNLRVEGREHVERLCGPLVLAANHTSHFDTPAVLFGLPRERRDRLAVMMGMRWFRARFGPLGNRTRPAEGLLVLAAELLFAAFPIETRSVGEEPSAGESASALRAVLRVTGELMDEGWSVLVYPEGEFARNGLIGPFRPGVGELALKMHVPVVPVRLRGLGKIMPPGASLPRRRWAASVVFGPAIHPLMSEGDPAEFAHRVRDAVLDL